MLRVLGRQLLFPVSIKPLWLLFLGCWCFDQRKHLGCSPIGARGFSVLPEEHPGHPEDCISAAQGELVGYGE